MGFSQDEWIVPELSYHRPRSVGQNRTGSRSDGSSCVRMKWINETSARVIELLLQSGNIMRRRPIGSYRGGYRHLGSRRSGSGTRCSENSVDMRFTTDGDIRIEVHESGAGIHCIRYRIPPVDRKQQPRMASDDELP